MAVGDLLADAEQDFQTLFGQEYKRVALLRNARASATLASQMMETVGSVENRPDLDILLWTHIADLGAKDPSGFAVATESLKQLLQKAPDASPKWLEKLTAVYRRQYAMTARTDRAELGDQQAAELITIGDEQLKAERGPNALATYRKALSIAILSKSDRRTDIVAKIRDANAQAAKQREILRMTKAVAADPDNVKMRAAVVKYYMFELDNPVKAATFLNDDLDEQLRTYVRLAVKDTDDLDADTSMGLGRWYWEMYPTARTINAKVAILGRTRTYLNRFLALHTETDLARVRAELILKKVTVESVKLGSAGLGASKKPGVIADFESPRLTGWVFTGTAFGKGPCDGKVDIAAPASGFEGKGMVSSCHGGDTSVGTLTSPKFTIRGKSITFLVAGGQWGGRSEARVGMDLLVEGKSVRSVTGHTSNNLRHAGWDVSGLVGKSAQIRIVDTDPGSWGHIHIDQIAQHPETLDTVIKPVEKKTGKADPKKKWKSKKDKGKSGTRDKRDKKG
jgi:hypothetical protein